MSWAVHRLHRRGGRRQGRRAPRGPSELRAGGY